MAAFVPGPGLTLSSSRSFVTGTEVTKVAPRQECPSQTPTVWRAQPQANFLLSFLKNLKNPFGSTAVDATKPGKPKPVTKVKSPVRMDAEMIKRGQEARERAMAKIEDSGLPKFYNPTTARAEFSAKAKGQNSTVYDIRLKPTVTPTNRRENANGTFRNMDEYTDDLHWARPGWSSSEARVGINVALRNVMGNANMLESDRDELANSISCVTKTADMKEFVRAIGLSNVYRKRYFESTSNMRFIECNFLHFLGRAPQSQEEIAEHIRIINEEGYNAEINSYVDSDEYDALFGNSRIPAPNFRGGHNHNMDMNKLAALTGGYVRTDAIYKTAFMASGNSFRYPPAIITKGMPEAWLGENAARAAAGPLYDYGDVFWKPYPWDVRDPEIAYKKQYGVLRKFWYVGSQISDELMEPVLEHGATEELEAAMVLKHGSTMGKFYSGNRTVSIEAPVITVTPPGEDIRDACVFLEMQEMKFPIPPTLKQTV